MSVRARNRDYATNSSGAALALEAQVRAAAFSALRADTYTLDGVSGKVASFDERSTLATGIGSSHKLTQATSAQQCAVPAALSTVRGRMAATFLDQRYSSNAVVSTFTFMHDGPTGCTVYNMWQPDTVTGSDYLLTTAFSGTSRGYATGRSSATAVLFIGNGTASCVNINGGTVAIGTPIYTRTRLDAAQNPDADIFIGTASAATKATPDAAYSSGDATATLMLGNRVSLVNAPFIGKWMETLIFKGAYDAAVDQLVRDYFTAYYGVT
jgi:hypothetical protein